MDALYHGFNDIASMLLLAKANVLAKDKANRSTLFYAIATNNTSILQFLLQKNSCLDADTYGRTPLLYAARFRYCGNL